MFSWKIFLLWTKQWNQGDSQIQKNQYFSLKMFTAENVLCQKMFYVEINRAWIFLLSKLAFSSRQSIVNSFFVLRVLFGLPFTRQNKEELLWSHSWLHNGIAWLQLAEENSCSTTLEKNLLPIDVVCLFAWRTSFIDMLYILKAYACASTLKFSLLFPFVTTIKLLPTTWPPQCPFSFRLNNELVPGVWTLSLV